VRSSVGIQVMHFVIVTIFLIGGIISGWIARYLLFSMARSVEDADERRKKHKKYPIPSDVNHLSSWAPNSRGVLIHQQQFIPKAGLKGVIMMCHGYGDHTLDFLTETALKFCQHQFAVITADAEVCSR
jgi:hypothetical protein